MSDNTTSYQSNEEHEQQGQYLKAFNTLRLKLELGGYRYRKKKAEIYQWGLQAISALAGASVVAVSIYSAVANGLAVTGYVFLISAGTWLCGLGMNFASVSIRSGTIAKQESTSQNIWFFEPLFSYYPAAVLLATGYICAQECIKQAICSAMTAEFSAIAGAITGAVIAIPSIWIGPCQQL